MALAIAVVAYVAEPESRFSWHTRLVASWDAGAHPLPMPRMDDHRDARTRRSTRAHALAQDTSGFIIFLFVLGPPVERRGDRLRRGHDRGARVLAEGVAPRTHRGRVDDVVDVDPDRFAFHYARALLRRRDGAARRSSAGGLAFPGGADPDYMDFAYYSFVVGMTSQGLRRPGAVAETCGGSRWCHGVLGVHLQHRGARAQHQHHRKRHLIPPSDRLESAPRRDGRSDAERLRICYCVTIAAACSRHSIRRRPPRRARRNTKQ